MKINQLDRPLFTATHWGAYNPVVKNGKLVEMKGVDFDPDPSKISDGWLDAYDHPARIQQPCIRRGYYENGLESDTNGRGCEPFVAVSWDQAEKIVADSLSQIKNEHGNEAIYAGSYGWASAGKFHHAPSQLHRFLNCIGGFTYSVNTYSFASAEVLVPHVLGNFFVMLVAGTAWPSIIENTDLFVAFGGLPIKNTQVEFGGHARHVQRDYIRRAKEAGVEFVSISPIRDDSQRFLESEWHALVPNTDVALMLGLAHTLYEHDLHDQEFLEKYCVGFDRFAEYLTGSLDGQPKTAEWASKICEIEAKIIRDLAFRMANQRTMVTVSWSLTRQDHGEHAYWMVIVLATMLGQIGLPGGGVGFGYSSTNGVGNQVGRLRYENLPVGKNPVSSFIPVARVSDLLLNPGQEFDYNGTRYTYPEIQMVYWAGGNPFHHHQDLNRLIKAWRRPKCTIVHDSFWTSAAKYSDIVLPVATALERTDVSSSPRDPHAIYMDQILPKKGNCRTDYEVFVGIARKLGVETEFTENRSVDDWIELMYERTKQREEQFGSKIPNFEEFKKKGWFRIKSPKKPGILLEPFRRDPDKKPLRTPSGKIEIFSESIDSFGYDNCPGHPTWMPPSEWLGHEDTQDDELHLISNQPQPRLHSQLDHGSYSQASKVGGREPVRINPEDARSRGIENYDVVRVSNKRGAFLATAVIDSSLRNRVVQIATGAWFDPEDPDAEFSVCKHGNPNTVTHDLGTSKLAQGPAAMTCVVRLEKYQGKVPEVTAHKPPEIIDSEGSK